MPKGRNNQRGRPKVAVDGVEIRRLRDIEDLSWSAITERIQASMRVCQTTIRRAYAESLAPDARASQTTSSANAGPLEPAPAKLPAYRVIKP